MSQKPKTIKAPDFEAGCLALLEEVARTGETIVITKNGRPIADLVPHRAKSAVPWEFGKGKSRSSATSCRRFYPEWARDIDAELKKRRGRDD